jgi:hypothetical protein
MNHTNMQKFKIFPLADFIVKTFTYFQNLSTNIFPIVVLGTVHIWHVPDFATYYGDDLLSSCK